MKFLNTKQLIINSMRIILHYLLYLIKSLYLTQELWINLILQMCMWTTGALHVALGLGKWRKHILFSTSHRQTIVETWLLNYKSI